ncbi:MAG: helix-turn-helix domain-containing protein [Pyrinomonadaceae bacterium]
MSRKNIKEVVAQMISNESDTSASIRLRIKLLSRLAATFVDEIQGLGEMHQIEIERGFDFYEEVRQFEINLIERALKCTGGHQVQAARLLKLNTTTLNSKIKHYQIPINSEADPPDDKSVPSSQALYRLVR